MPRKEGQKAKLMRLAQIFAEETDENHRLSVNRLVERLDERFGIVAERKSIYDDIDTLRELGFDILQQRGRGGGYCMGERAFELAELKLLIDAVQASRFITARKSEKLIQKLSRFASSYQAQDLRRQVFASSRVKTMNESIYYTVDELHQAIAQDRQVSFVYVDWNREKERVPRHEGKRYRVSPWALLWEEENYYLVGWDPKTQALRHYRVDKMEKLFQLKKQREGREQYDPQKMRNYAKPLFGMYSGQVHRLNLSCREELVGPMLDRFGSDVTLIPVEEGWVHVHADVAVSPTFFGWLCGFGGRVRILEPASVRTQFEEHLQTTLSESRKP